MIKIDSFCIDMFSPLEPKLLMDVFTLTKHQQNYDLIKHMNEDSVHTIYFDPQKYLFRNKLREKDILSYAKIWQPLLSIMVIR